MNTKAREGLRRWMLENHVSVKKVAPVLAVSIDSIYRALRGLPISKEFAWKLHILTGMRLMDLMFDDVDRLINESLDILRFKGSL